jgi:hypothetical protein
MFVPSKVFQPSQMIVGKARSLPKSGGAAQVLDSSVDSWNHHNIRVGWKSCQGRT